MLSNGPRSGVELIRAMKGLANEQTKRKVV